MSKVERLLTGFWHPLLTTLTTMQIRERVLALDVMRGITIAAMILVNNPASWGIAYEPLRHVPWHGMTPTDFIYPFFMFIMGISSYFSLSKYQEGMNGAVFTKILRRSIVIFAIGVGLQAISYFGYGTSNYLLGNSDPQSGYLDVILPLERFRIMGVLQGLAVAYFFGAVLVLFVRFKYLLCIAGTMLLAYVVILTLGNGYELASDNIIAVIDRAILGEQHLYIERLADGTKVAFEPEALLSSIPRIAQVILGIYVGRLLTTCKDHLERINRLFIFGTILLFAGMLLQYGDPVNKKIWSTSFTLVTTGFGSLLLALLIWIIDIRKHARWSAPFESFGVNPLFLYVLAWVGSVLFGVNFRFGGTVTSIKGFLFRECIQPYAGDAFGSLIYSLLFVSLIWLFGYILYRNKIYIKI